MLVAMKGETLPASAGTVSAYMALLVQKYGGTSVGDPDRIRAVADQVARCQRRGDQVVVVVSAMGNETDELLHLASLVSRSRPGREMDMLITAGERKATALLCMALHDLGVAADSFTGSQAGFLTDTTHTNAKIVEVRPERVRLALEAGRVPVVGGSQGMSTARDVTFLGRGGSDTTAVALAAALEADVCEIYTDVEGVFSADPRIVPGARKLHAVSWEEMLELAASGAKVLMLRSVEYARNYGVLIHVRSSFSEEEGTWVREEDERMEQAIIAGVAHDTSEAKVTIVAVPDQPGVAARIFRPLADEGVNVDMIVQNVSEHGRTDISFTLPKEDLKRASAMVEATAAAVGAEGIRTDEEIAKVSLVGAGMKSHPGVAADMFDALSEVGINIDIISTSSIRISCVVAASEVERAVRAIHDRFQLSEDAILREKHPLTATDQIRAVRG